MSFINISGQKKTHGQYINIVDWGNMGFDIILKEGRVHIDSADTKALIDFLIEKA